MVTKHSKSVLSQCRTLTDTMHTRLALPSLTSEKNLYLSLINWHNLCVKTSGFGKKNKNKTILPSPPPQPRVVPPSRAAPFPSNRRGPPRRGGEGRAGLDRAGPGWGGGRPVAGLGWGGGCSAAGRPGSRCEGRSGGSRGRVGQRTGGILYVRHVALRIPGGWGSTGLEGGERVAPAGVRVVKIWALLPAVGLIIRSGP